MFVLIKLTFLLIDQSKNPSVLKSLAYSRWETWQKKFGQFLIDQVINKKVAKNWPKLTKIGEKSGLQNRLDRFQYE